ncbi:hypothetical protein CLBKND_01057 [Methylorubrum aminovorans]
MPIIVLFSMMAAVLHVAATDSIDGEVPRRSRIALGFCVGVAVLRVGAIAATRPDIGPAIKRATLHRRLAMDGRARVRRVSDELSRLVRFQPKPEQWAQPPVASLTTLRRSPQNSPRPAQPRRGFS